jgi:hypothetical protein
MDYKLVPFDEAKEWPKPDFFEYDYGHHIHGNRYLAPYMQLLMYCFGILSTSDKPCYYTVAPEHLPRDCVIGCSRRLGRQHSLEFFVVFNIRGQVVAFAQVVDKETEMKNSRRRKPFDDIYYLADQQMRTMFKHMLGTRPIRTFWGLSFVDKSLRVYRGDNETGEVTPADVGLPSESDWNIDISSAAGLEAMQGIVQDMKDNSASPRRVF